MLSRKEALEILNLPEDATIYDVERRYTLISKSLRGKDDEETFKRIDQVTMAYDILTGRYEPPTPVDPKMEKEVFGKKRKDWKNIWDYGKVPFFITLAVVILIVVIIYQVATNEPIDFQLSAFGRFYKRGEVLDEKDYKLMDVIREQNPDLKHPIITLNYIGKEGDQQVVDPQAEVGAMVKRMLMAAGAEKVDIALLDKDQYDSLVKEGLFLPMDDLYNKLSEEKPDLFTTYAIKPCYFTVSAELLPEGEGGQEHIYALDLSEKQLLNSLDMVGREQYLALVYHSEDRSKSQEILEKLLLSIDSWYDPTLGLMEAEPKVTPTPMPSSTNP